MLVVFFRAIFLYALVTISLRLMGKRQLGELQPSELVITILISNIASLPIEDADIPMALGIIPVLVLVAFEIIISNVSLQSPKFRSLISGKPVIVIHDGKLDQKQLRKLRFSIDDLMESLRQQGVFNLQDVQYAIVETTGKVSVLQKFSAQTVTPEMLQLKGKEQSPPVVAVSDGQVIPAAIKPYGLNEEWILTALSKKKQKLSDVFLMTVDKEKNIYIIPKAESRKSHA